ncbi:MAG: hypothetical protein ABIC68_08350 [Candidatus Omnitrophota bacterium]
MNKPQLAIKCYEKVNANVFGTDYIADKGIKKAKEMIEKRPKK